MRFSALVATTELVKRGDIYVRISVEAMESGISKMNGIPLIHSHNPSLLPLGKIEKGWVERSSETEAALYQSTYLDTSPPERFIHEFSKTPCVRISFTESPGRFYVAPEQLDRSVTVDMTALTKGKYDRFVEDVSNYDEHITVSFHDRREEIPIPLIRFILDLSLAETLLAVVKITLLGAAVSGRLARWTEETVKWIKNDCAPVLKAYHKHKSEKARAKEDEWVVLVLDSRQFDGPLIELVIPSKDGSDIPTDAIPKFAEQICEFGDLLSETDKIVFVYYPDSEQCEFRYALTKKGGVIGSESCYEEAAAALEMWLATKREGTSVWWTLVTKEDGELAMQLFLLGGDYPKPLGYLSVDPDSAKTLLQVYDADDNALHPFRIEESTEES